MLLSQVANSGRPFFRKGASVPRNPFFMQPDGSFVTTDTDGNEVKHPAIALADSFTNDWATAEQTTTATQTQIRAALVACLNQQLTVAQIAEHIFKFIIDDNDDPLIQQPCDQSGQV